MKVKDIKAKVAAKVAKGKAKVAAKCGKAAKCAALVFGLASLVLVGCQSVPSRSQTLTIRDCTITVYGGPNTNAFATVEMGTQAMAIETGGNETNSPSQTTDTKPEIAVGVGGSSAGVGSSGAAKQGVGAAIGGAVDAVSGLFTGGSSGDSAKATDAATPKSDCSGGSCSPCADGQCSTGTCTDGSCKP